MSSPDLITIGVARTPAGVRGTLHVMPGGRFPERRVLASLDLAAAPPGVSDARVALEVMTRLCIDLTSQLASGELA